MRTMFSEFPDDVKTFDMDDQWLIGGSILVKPATAEGQTAVDVYLPLSQDTDAWYELNTLVRAPVAAGGVVTIDTPLEHLPVYIRSGVSAYVMLPYGRHGYHGIININHLNSMHSTSRMHHPYNTQAFTYHVLPFSESQDTS